jgi:hypothetical protein
MRILVSGMVAGDPGQGGATWAVLQYALGLRDLGHDVFLVEPIAPRSIRPDATELADSVNAHYFHAVSSRFGLHGRAALLRQDTGETVGLSYPEIVRAAATTDVLLNVSGMLRDPNLRGPIPCQVYLDLDPAFNQLWYAVEGIDVGFDGHTHFVTVGNAIGQATCAVPTCGRTWIPTLQPILLSEWPVTPGDALAPWTTIGNWRGYGSIESGGVHFGQKAHSQRRFMGVPRRTAESFLLALAIHSGEVNDLAALKENGWGLVDPAEVSATPDDYRRFIRGSKAEFGIAKSGYVVSRCGWFSDRSVCYLASGRPVLAQDTGFSGAIPAGGGLVAFSTEEEAIAGIEAISSDYEHHARAAREVAEACFDSKRVLSRLLEEVGHTRL